MVIFDDLNYITCSDNPNGDWTNGQARYVVDDNSELCARIMRSPAFEPVEDDDGGLVDIIPLSTEGGGAHEQQDAL